MLTVEQARAIMLGACARLSKETVALEAALGRTLAAPIVASRDAPPFAASAMDGYAFAAADAPGQLRIVGESSAGHGFSRALGVGEAVRISTGAALPAGADCVLIQEDAAVEGDQLTAPACKRGAHVRPLGGDFGAGEELLTGGRILDAAAVGLIAAAGVAQVVVTRKPRLYILPNGDELVPPGETPGPFQIFDAASFAVAALARDWGAEAIIGAPLGDAPNAIADAVRSLPDQYDIVVLIGGASVGPHDYARSAPAQLGYAEHFDKIAVRPGKPTWFATGAGAHLVGLPGNPASALVCARLFLAPMIETMLAGATRASLTLVSAKLAAPRSANGGREHYLRAKLTDCGAGERVATIHADQDSSLLSVFSSSNALVRLAPDAPASPAGALAEAFPLGLLSI